jgi:signal transduction histidine kinase
MNESPLAAHPVRILIVDDERHNRQLLEIMLTPDGFHILTAASGEEALSIIAQHPPDLILLDVMMPGMDGYQIVSKIKNNPATKDILVIMVTALGDRAARMFALNAGAEEFLTKPVDRAELRVRVRNLARLKTYSDDNARLYAVANDARAVAEEAQVHAKAAQHQAEAANSAKAQFLANMSHELRTPLNAIGGYAQIMEMGLHGAITEAQRNDLGRIQRSQAHLLGLINAVLNYAKLEAGQIIYATQDIVLNEVMVDAESLVAPQLRAKGLQYHYTPCPESSDGSCMIPTRVNTDPEKLRQILLNLLSNAIKFTASGGQITVACRTADGTASVSVTDTGCGIPIDKLQTIFDPFVQVGRGLNSTDAGIGLGLAISRDLAIGMGGDLTVESVEGEGSTFTVILQLAA